ncbi:MAG: VacB/RNase II family 3'-5' exoribonuclease, partial [Coriobacteriales bacterium]|nr:VacB/RNase II family 3'-5' exoribonuclease [Coriobacteriales bacterium]
DPKLDRFVLISPNALGAAKDGDAVVAGIIAYPSHYEELLVGVSELLDLHDARDRRMEMLIASHGLHTTFDEAVLAQAEQAILDVDSALEQSDRVDLRDRFIFTIDPWDAKDFDDAISIEDADEGCLRLGVHIADVSHYVPWDSPIDREARTRGCSVYLADRVLPMLPPRLSDDLCSLAPGQDRLAFTVELLVDKRGEVLQYDFHPSVIRSSARLDYDQVQAFYQGADLPVDIDSPRLREALVRLRALARARFKRRLARGGIDLDNPELKLHLDEDGQVLEIIQRRRTDATGAIEEAMIMANEAVATFLESRLESMVYRIHEIPDRDRMEALVPLLQHLGYDCKGVAAANPKAIQRVLEHAQGRPEQDFVQARVLRSLKRAQYSNHNRGHYGLASDCYTHFTSPIRRYPDLMVHRLLRAALAGFYDQDGRYSSRLAQRSPLYGEPSLKGLRSMGMELEALCSRSSTCERVAQDASLDSVQLKLCQHLAGRLGESFHGIVSGISNQGMQVLIDQGIRGLVPMDALGDEYFEVDDLGLSLTGEDSRRSWRVGQSLDLVLKEVDLHALEIRFALAGRKEDRR